MQIFFQTNKDTTTSNLTFKSRAKTFLKKYNSQLKNTPLKETILKSIQNEANFLGEGKSKKGYNLIGFKDYVIRIYKEHFKPEDLDLGFQEPSKNYLNTLNEVILSIPNKIDIVKKKTGKSIGVNNYSERIKVGQNPLQNIYISREETLESLHIYEQLKDFPLDSYKQAYSQLKKFCKKPGYQFDIISPNNILIDTKLKKINLIDPVSPAVNKPVHGEHTDLSYYHGCDSLYPTLCDFLLQEEHFKNLNLDEILRWQNAIRKIIAKCILAGNQNGLTKNTKKLRILYNRIDNFWKSKENCRRYDNFQNLYSETINFSHTIINALNHKNPEETRINAIKNLNAADFEELLPIFKKLILAPHQPKVEIPEILNPTLDKIAEYNQNAIKIIPTLEKLFNKELFFTTKKRLYNLFISLQPDNKTFLEEMKKSSLNPFEKTLYEKEFHKLKTLSSKMKSKQKLEVEEIYKTFLNGDRIPKNIVDKLWISRTCTTSNSAQNTALKNMLNGYSYIEAHKNQIPRISDLIELHKIILNNTPNEGHLAGTLRTPETDHFIKQIFKIKKNIKKPVNPYSESKDVVNDLKQFDNFIQSNYETMDTFLLASHIFSEAIRIHPFLNGNGRATRLFVEQFLLSKGYNLTRWPEESLYRKIVSVEKLAEYLKSCSEKI